MESNFRFDNIQTDSISVFVGAGLSKGAGLPDWYELIHQLAREISYEVPPPEWTNSETFIDISQSYVNAYGLQRLIGYLQQKLDTTHVRPSIVHKALALLPCTNIFTSNYDDLLEKSFRQVNKKVRLITRDIHVPLMTHDSLSANIVKLYGDLNQPETIVLTRQHYEKFFLERPLLINQLKSTLSNSTMIYLGWSHRDPHFNLVFGELLNQLGGFMRHGYALMIEPTGPQKKRIGEKRNRSYWPGF